MSTKFMQYCREQLSEEFKKTRLEQNLNIAEVALKSSLSINHIERIENGEDISFGRYFALAKFYGKKLKFGLE